VYQYRIYSTESFAMPKQVIVQSSIEAVEIIDTPIPIPKDKEIVIQVVVAGTNPKDWKYPLWQAFPSTHARSTKSLTGRIGRITAVMIWQVLCIQ
jgi:NADPH:quinone reductase